MRYAIYFTPPESDPLARAAARWLGRSAFGGAALSHGEHAGMTSAELAYLTAAARRYGFHATMKAPFRLAGGETEGSLDAALARFCERVAPLLVRLVPARLDGFLALVPERSEPLLGALARDVVAAFEPFRAPLTDAEILRRNPGQLSPAQLSNLQRWGYPYVLDEFRFHMTLTGRVGEEEAPRARRAIEEHFGPLLEEPVVIGGLALFVEPEPGAPFLVRSHHAFTAHLQRKSA